MQEQTNASQERPLIPSHIKRLLPALFWILLPLAIAWYRQTSGG